MTADEERAAIVALVEAARDCADDLEAEVNERWGFDKRLAHKLQRDMRPVYAVRKAIERVEARAHRQVGE